MALGTLREAALSRATTITKDCLSHSDFFERALSVKPSLTGGISSLQGLILLHWYLYTEVSEALSFLYGCRS